MDFFLHPLSDTSGSPTLTKKCSAVFIGYHPCQRDSLLPASTSQRATVAFQLLVDKKTQTFVNIFFVFFLTVRKALSRAWQNFGPAFAQPHLLYGAAAMHAEIAWARHRFGRFGSWCRVAFRFTVSFRVNVVRYSSGIILAKGTHCCRLLIGKELPRRFSR